MRAVNKSWQHQEFLSEKYFGNAKNWTRAGWVGSANATAVLCRPPSFLLFDDSLSQVLLPKEMNSRVSWGKNWRKKCFKELNERPLNVWSHGIKNGAEQKSPSLKCPNDLVLNGHQRIKFAASWRRIEIIVLYSCYGRKEIWYSKVVSQIIKETPVLWSLLRILWLALLVGGGAQKISAKVDS